MRAVRLIAHISSFVSFAEVSRFVEVVSSWWLVGSDRPQDGGSALDETRHGYNPAFWVSNPRVVEHHLSYYYDYFYYYY